MAGLHPIRNGFLILLALTGLASALYAAYRWYYAPSDTSRYRVAAIERGLIVKAVSANGTLNPVVLVNVGTQVSGTIAKLRADFNDRVRENQVLAELDPRLFKAALEQSRGNLANARAALKLAEANERRMRALLARNYVARLDFDQAVQALEAARAQVEANRGQVRRDQTNLGYAVITSPISGVVVSRNVDVGQTVAASFQTPTLFTIAQDLQHMQIDTTVAEADVGGIRVGQPATFTVDAFPERTFQGIVRQIRLNPQVQQNVVTYDVVIDLNNPEEILLPGMTAFVNIAIAERRDSLRLPLAALRFHPADGEKREEGAPGKSVYRLQGNRAVVTPVQTGIADGKYAEVTGGTLGEGDSVILEDLSERKAESQTQAAGGFRLRAF
ncbi:MAG TPA: efflux RND transporter periplasmic adaptor subunit [Methylococcaceae bacterium]|jgi:HlyD family secretion protein|nr:efflux RND transporter periplasmic adaptor subunit [Methylococcaceae bacterium]